jgi:hypothetical protein
MEKAKKFYEKRLRPRKKQLNNTQMRKPLVNHPIGEHQQKEHDWSAHKHTYKKREPPLIDHSKVFE